MKTWKVKHGTNTLELKGLSGDKPQKCVQLQFSGGRWILAYDIEVQPLWELSHWDGTALGLF